MCRVDPLLYTHSRQPHKKKLPVSAFPPSCWLPTHAASARVHHLRSQATEAGGPRRGKGPCCGTDAPALPRRPWRSGGDGRSNGGWGRGFAGNTKPHARRRAASAPLYQNSESYRRGRGRGESPVPPAACRRQVRAARVAHLEEHEVGDEQHEERHGQHRSHGPVERTAIDEEGGKGGVHQHISPRVHDSERHGSFDL